MTAILIEFSFAGFAAVVGIAVGWWLRGHGTTDSEHADEETRRARDVLGRLHDLAARVAADVGEHSSRVEEINEELASGEARETNVVVSAVHKLVQANDQMQRQLATAEQRLQEQARQIQSHATEARTDALTALANRRAFDDRVERCVADFNATGKTFSIIMLDVDHFKNFNDTHGHRAGDEVLRGVGHLLRANTPDGGLPSRYGGEEFAIVLPGTTAAEAIPQAEKVRKAIDGTDFRFESNTFHVSVSVGVSNLLEWEDVAMMIERSDKALYTSKATGRNRTHWHDGQQIYPVNQPAEQTTVEPEAKVEAPKPDKKPETAVKQPETTTEKPKGICDGATFCRVLGHRLAEWRRGGTEPSILFIRIDDYQSVVSARGEQVGRRILDTTMQFLQAAIRDMDLVAHYETTTFALLMPGAGLQNAVAAGERLRRAIGRCVLPADDGQLRFTVSVGGAEAAGTDDTRKLLERAQEALGAAAKSGGDCSYFHNGQWSETALATLDKIKAS